MQIIEIAKKEITGGHIRIMLFIEIAKLELSGGHTGIMLSRDYQNRFNWRPYWNYANYRYCQKRIKRRPYLN